MSEHDSQHELADELLSAYLDDELSPAERAAVESRLANDPAAQQMLHQLRTVSQSIQRLPLESIGADVRGKVLDRIQGLESSAQPKAAADGQLSPAGGELPKITIFNSRRSWIWASLAVAAGLMIMFLERGEERNKQLPAIAKNDTVAAAGRRLEDSAPPAARDRSAKVSADSSSLALDEKPSVAPLAAPAAPPAPSAAPVATAAPASPPMQLGAPVEVAGTLAKSATPASPAIAPPNESKREVGLIAGGSGGAKDNLSDASRGESDRSNTAKMPAAAAKGMETIERPAISSGGDMNTAAAIDSLVVVHVLATPTAIQNRAFDKLLVSNGIHVETDSLDDEGRNSGKNPPAREFVAAARPAGGLRAPQPTDQVDMVLVDAPEAAVKSCLADLKKDADNYAGVEIEETPSTDRAKKQLDEKKEKVAAGLAQYNRGMIPQQQKDNFRNQLFFDQRTERQQQASAEATATAEPLGNASNQLNLEELRRVQQRAQSSNNRGRALRFSQSNTENLQRSARGSAASSAGTLAFQNAPVPPTQQIVEPSTKKLADSNLQVLFMLSPAEEPTAGKPAEKRAE